MSTQHKHSWGIFPKDRLRNSKPLLNSKISSAVPLIHPQITSVNFDLVSFLRDISEIRLADTRRELSTLNGL
jgi:hypothetical protein